MKAVSSPIILTSLRSKKDKSAGGTIEFPELTGEEFSALRELQGINLLAVLSPTDEEETDVQEITTELNEKTPSQRLRGSLFVLLEKKLGRPSTPDEWRSYYETTMNHFVENIKNKIREYD